MANRDILLMIGFLRSGRMHPTVTQLPGLSTRRSLRIAHEVMEEQEREIFGRRPGPMDADDLKRRAALTSWSGEPLAVGTRVEEVPDPGVVLGLLYDVPTSSAPLPVEVFAQTLRRYALRDAAMRDKFEAHVDVAGTFVPAWLSPEVRRQRSQEAFDAAMKVARDKGFAHAAPLFEGVRGECFAAAQVAIAVYEIRELGDAAAALRRLDEVVRFAPRNVAARMQRARLLVRDASRKVEAAGDYMAVLRELSRPDADSRAVREAAISGLWALHRDFAEPHQLEAARALAQRDFERGYEALSRYIHTHPCAWDAHVELAALAVAMGRFDAAVKLLAGVRWLFPDDARPHLVQGQALASKGYPEAALEALRHAAELAPDDANVTRWIEYAESSLASARDSMQKPPSVRVVDHLARTLLVLSGEVRRGRLVPSAIVLHKLPGDVSLTMVVQALVTQERRRHLNLSSSGELEVSRAGERCVMSDWSGEALTPEHTVGDVKDPGIVVALLYPEVRRDDVGRPAFDPPPDASRASLLGMARHNTEIAGKLEKHLRSQDATVKARLESEDEVWSGRL